MLKGYRVFDADTHGSINPKITSPANSSRSNRIRTA